MSSEVDALIRHYGLQPHPEGGYFKETYRSEGSIPRSALPAEFKGDRSFSTGILFLLSAGAVSRLHRIASDEVWHFLHGGPMTVVQLSPEGRVQLTRLGPNWRSGQAAQHVVPAGHWFGAHADPGSEYSLVGCTVAPGFDFADFELARRDELLKAFPAARGVIEHLT